MMKVEETNPKRGLQYVMPFGKYKGDTIQDIIATEPLYILFLHKRDIISLEEEVIDAAQRKISRVDNDGYYPDPEFEDD
jgi:uncharacterized protein (DUF3820 family)